MQSLKDRGILDNGATQSVLTQLQVHERLLLDESEQPSLRELIALGNAADLPVDLQVLSSRVRAQRLADITALHEAALT